MSINFISPVVKFWRQNFTKLNFDWGSAADRVGGAEGAYDPPPDPVAGWGGGYSLTMLLYMPPTSTHSAPRNSSPKTSFAASSSHWLHSQIPLWSPHMSLKAVIQSKRVTLKVERMTEKTVCACS